MAEPEVWCRVTVLGLRGDELEHWTVSGPGRPDLAAVEVLARLQLDWSRRGGRLAVRDLCPGLADLLKLAGLSLEVRGEVEEREDRLGVEEEMEAADPPI